MLRLDGTAAIPKAGTPQHLMESRAALDLRLSAADWQRWIARSATPRSSAAGDALTITSDSTLNLS